MLIPLRGGQQAAHELIVFTPTLSGTLFAYLDVIRSMPQQCRIYGLPNRYVEESLPGQGSAYAQDLAEVLAPGTRFHIVGWSYGGLLAYELAVHLAELDLIPTCTFLLDAPLPEPEDKTELFRTIDHRFVEMILEDVDDDGEYTSLSHMKRAIWDAGYKLKSEDLDQMYFNYVNNYGKWCKYTPSKSNIPVVVFEAQERRWSSPHFRRWSSVAQDLTFVPTESDHYTIVKNPAATHVAAYISNCLQHHNESLKCAG